MNHSSGGQHCTMSPRAAARIAMLLLAPITLCAPLAANAQAGTCRTEFHHSTDDLKSAFCENLRDAISRCAHPFNAECAEREATYQMSCTRVVTRRTIICPGQPVRVITCRGTLAEPC